MKLAWECNIGTPRNERRVSKQFTRIIGVKGDMATTRFPERSYMDRLSFPRAMSLFHCAVFMLTSDRWYSLPYNTVRSIKGFPHAYANSQDRLSGTGRKKTASTASSELDRESDTVNCRNRMSHIRIVTRIQSSSECRARG